MLVPQYIRSNREKLINDKKEKYFLVQDQFHAQLSSGDILELQDIDRNLDWKYNVTV